METNRDRDHPMTDDSEAETEIINGSKPNTPHKLKDVRLDGAVSINAKQTPADSSAREPRAIVSPTPINGKKRKVSSDESNHPSSRGQSRTRSPSTETSAPKRPRRSARDEDDASSEDDAQDEPPNDVGRRDARRAGRRPAALQTRSARSSVSRTDVSSPREDRHDFVRSHSPLRSTHRRSASHHAAAAAFSERERRTRRRVASSEVVANEESPAPSATTVPRKQRDHHGRTALAKACDDGDEERVQALLTAHPDEVNMEDYAGNTPLQFACNAGHIGVVKMLLAAGANIDTCNRDGETPYKDAQDAGEEEILELLRGAGYDPSKAKSQHKQYPKNRSHFLVYSTKALLNYVKDGDVEAVGEVATNGVKIENRHVVAACEHGYSEILNLLLGLGGVGNPNPNKVKDVPMHMALREGTAGVATLLRAQPDFDPLGNCEGQPYYKAALKRNGSEWHAEARALRDAFVKAKRAKGEQVDVDEDMEEAVEKKRKDDEEATKAGAKETQSADEADKMDADRPPSPDKEVRVSREEPPEASRVKGSEIKDSTKTDLNMPKTEETDEGLLPEHTVERPSTANNDKPESPPESAAANANGELLQVPDKGESPSNKESGESAPLSTASARQPEAAVVSPLSEQTAEGALENEKALPQRDCRGEPAIEDKAPSPPPPTSAPPADAMDVDPPAAAPEQALANGVAHTEALSTNGDATETSSQPDPPSKADTSSEPTALPDPPTVNLPQGLAHVLGQGPNLPLSSIPGQAWIKSVRDFCTIEVFYLGELEPQCDPSEADDLYMMGFQASVILGHETLGALPAIKNPPVRTRPMTHEHRARLWYQPTLRELIARDMHHDIAPREVVKASGIPWEEEALHNGETQPLMYIRYRNFDAAQKALFLDLPETQCVWVSLGDFLRLARPEVSPRLRTQYMKVSGKMHLDFDQDERGRWIRREGRRRPDVPEQFYLAGEPVETPTRIVY